LKKIIYAIILTLSLSGCANINWWGETDSVKISKGDTLYSISRQYGVPLKQLISINNLQAPYTLKIGQKLQLPTKQYHSVKKGDTLYSISRQYDVDVTSLSKLNQLTTPYALAVGQELILPASTSSKFETGNITTIKAPQKKNSVKITQKSTPVKNRKTKFDWPVKGKIISGYGNLGSGRKNDGINIKASLGTPVKAADAGTVAYAGNELKGFGNLVLIKHSDGWITAYAHNDKLLVHKGQKVQRGVKIATVGSTGSVTTPQLHFEVRAGKKAVNPRSYLP
jgi:murein DD-endopeptidase MepM/ murein hydrolase activator NlpD